MHQLVQMQHIARKEFERGLTGLSDEDARKRIDPMNSITWIIGHIAWHQHLFFVALPKDQDERPEYGAFGTDAPASTPSLDDVVELWRTSCIEADGWLDNATDDSLMQLTSPWGDKNGGTLLVRNIFHTWEHLGEISAIRQILGHRPPEFVDMYGWQYMGMKED